MQKQEKTNPHATNSETTTETLNDLIQIANEPIRLLTHLLNRAGDTEIDLFLVAVLLEALQEVVAARIKAILHVVETQIGMIKISGVREPHSLTQLFTTMTATLETPVKNTSPK